MEITAVNARHTLVNSDLAGSISTSIWASSTKANGKKLAIVTVLDKTNNIVTNIHVLKNTNGSSKELPRVVYVGLNLAEAIDKYNSLP